MSPSMRSLRDDRVFIAVMRLSQPAQHIGVPSAVPVGSRTRTLSGRKDEQREPPVRCSGKFDGFRLAPDSPSVTALVLTATGDDS